MEFVVITLYCITLLLIFLFSLGQLNLTWHYLKSKRKENKTAKGEKLQHVPPVTVQLPVYNEKYVVERLIDAVCKFDYPAELLEIQVLDDSTDETVEIIASRVKEWQDKGVDIKQVRREGREGFKAGALQYGLDISKGDFIAIFDADFLPDPDFLKRTLASFEEGVGLVQTRWGHLNKDYSILVNNIIDREKLNYAVPVYNPINITTIPDSKIEFTIPDDTFLEILLLRIRGETIKFSTELKKKSDEYEKKLEIDINNLENNCNPENVNLLFEKKTNIRKLS